MPKRREYPRLRRRGIASDRALTHKDAARSLGLPATLPFAQLVCPRGAATYVWRFAVSPQGAPPGSARGETLAQISTGLVQLHSRYYGKGPTKAKTHMVNGTVVSILRGGFTTVERTLIDTGEIDSVYRMRRSFQQAMENEFRQVVEEATGRNVIAYMSSINVDPDLAVEIFVLEPAEDTEPAPADSPNESSVDQLA
jgi:uncharacterized protein YbcI